MEFFLNHFTIQADASAMINAAAGALQKANIDYNPKTGECEFKCLEWNLNGIY